MKPQGEVNMGNGKLEKLKEMEKILSNLKWGKYEENVIDITLKKHWVLTEEKIQLNDVGRDFLIDFIEKQVEILRIEVLKYLGVYEK